MRTLVTVLTVLFLVLPTRSAALQAGPNDLYVRVVDVGPGLCVITKAPPGTFFVYDAGHWVASGASRRSARSSPVTASSCWS